MAHRIYMNLFTSLSENFNSYLILQSVHRHHIGEALSNHSLLNKIIYQDMEQMTIWRMVWTAVITACLRLNHSR